MFLRLRTVFLSLGTHGKPLWWTTVSPSCLLLQTLLSSLFFFIFLLWGQQGCGGGGGGGGGDKEAESSLMIKTSSIKQRSKRKLWNACVYFLFSVLSHSQAKTHKIKKVINKHPCDGGKKQNMYFQFTIRPNITQLYLHAGDTPMFHFHRFSQTQSTDSTLVTMQTCTNWHTHTHTHTHTSAESCCKNSLAHKLMHAILGQSLHHQWNQLFYLIHWNNCLKVLSACYVVSIASAFRVSAFICSWKDRDANERLMALMHT